MSCRWLQTSSGVCNTTNGFSIAIQIRWKFRFTLSSILIQWSLRDGMCKNLLPSDGQQLNNRKAKFPSNLNCGRKIVSETGPWIHLCWYSSSPKMSIFHYLIIPGNNAHISIIGDIEMVSVISDGRSYETFPNDALLTNQKWMYVLSFFQCNLLQVFWNNLYLGKLT